MSVIVTVNDGIQITSSSYSGENFQIIIADNSEYWQLSPERQVEALQTAKSVGIYVHDLGSIECAFSNYPDGVNRSHEIASLFEHGFSVDSLNRVKSNPFLSDEVKAEIQDLYERYVIILARRDLQRAPAKSLRKQVVDLDKSTCRYCGKLLGPAEIHIDHIVPYSLGGKTELENLAVACASCNIKKSGRTPESAGMILAAMEIRHE